MNKRLGGLNYCIFIITVTLSQNQNPFLSGPILRPFSGRGNFYIKIIKHWRAEGARENFAIFDEKGKH